MFHNLGHITVESGEYLRAFRAWGEAHKTLQTVSQLKNESIQETIESFTSNDKGLLKASKAPIDHAISKWLSIKQEVASSEYRCFCQTLGLMLVISQPSNFAGCQLEYTAFGTSNKFIKGPPKSKKKYWLMLLMKRQTSSELR
jgi:hypothetical protein